MEIHLAEENLESAFFTLNCKLNYYINPALFFVIPFTHFYDPCFLVVSHYWLNFYMHTKFPPKLDNFIEHTLALYRRQISFNPN
jgi:hypothetical protein